MLVANSLSDKKCIISYDSIDWKRLMWLLQLPDLVAAGSLARLSVFKSEQLKAGTQPHFKSPK